MEGADTSKTIRAGTTIVPSDLESVTIAPKTDAWTIEVGLMRATQRPYSPDRCAGAVAPPLPGTTNTGAPRSRRVVSSQKQNTEVACMQFF